MGNAISSKDLSEQKLVIKNRFLQKQIQNNTEIDAATKHSILSVKKTRTYTNLVFSGGSTKGLSYIGILDYLDKNRYLSNVTSYTCSSFGAVFIALYCIGYTIEEIKTIAQDLDYAKLSTTNKKLKSDNFHVGKDCGANNGQYLIDTITSLIEKRTGNKNYNLQQLWKEKGINLIVHVTDITTAGTKFFWYSNYPKMPLRILLRMSCSIPCVYAPVIFDGHYFIDGSLTEGLPIHIFDHDGVNPNTLGIHLLGDLNPKVSIYEQGDVSLQSTVDKETKIHSSFGYFEEILNTISSKSELSGKQSLWLRTIPVHTPSYGIAHFKLTKPQVKELFDYGYEAANDFFKK